MSLYDGDEQFRDAPFAHHNPRTFAERDFAKEHQEQYDVYVEYRVRFRHPSIAFRAAFGEHPKAHLAVQYLEHNDYYHWKFQKRMAETQVSELWDEKIAIHTLGCAAFDPTFKDTTRLNAMKELNVLTNITVVDEHGKTAKGRGLADFYADLRDAADVMDEARRIAAERGVRIEAGTPYKKH